MKVGSFLGAAGSAVAKASLFPLYDSKDAGYFHFCSSIAKAILVGQALKLELPTWQFSPSRVQYPKKIKPM
jgi:hypothetical protein